jgi:hypothetical protein
MSQFQSNLGPGLRTETVARPVNSERLGGGHHDAMMGVHTVTVKAKDLRGDEAETWEYGGLTPIYYAKSAKKLPSANVF